MRAAIVTLALMAPGAPGLQIDPGPGEEFGRGILEALRLGSFQALEPYVATADDFAELVATMPGISAGERTEALETKDAFAAEIRAHFVEEWELARAQIDYDDVQFVRMEVGSPRVPEEQPGGDPEALAEVRRRFAPIRIVVTYEGDELTINLRDCFKAERGWVLVERTSFGLLRWP
jgi:hypothetical protein